MKQLYNLKVILIGSWNLVIETLIFCSFFILVINHESKKAGTSHGNNDDENDIEAIIVALVDYFSFADIGWA